MATAVRVRTIDTAIAHHGTAAIQRLVSMIREAVSNEDDARATALDSVLKHVEKIIDAAQGGPADRQRH